MPVIRLVHWNSKEAEERANRLRAWSYQVDAAVPNPPEFLRRLAEEPPAALVIDLSRLPSQGRDLAMLARSRKTTAAIPLIMVGGNPGKVAHIRELLPDASYTSWEELPETLRAAVSQPRQAPPVTRSPFEAYRGRPLVAKLGIKAGSRVGLSDEPEGFRESLGPLPAGAQLCNGERTECDVLLWFVRTEADLLAGLARAAVKEPMRPLWIIWPKRASRVETDLTQRIVREAGLAAGLVDYRICALDATWSGLLFTRRRGS